MDPSRSVLIRYTRDSKSRRGSGLRVGGRFVLTADHCANGTNHRLVVGGREYPATVHERSGSAAVDVAVLVADHLPALEPLRCALINRDVDEDLDGCRALGFPSWKKNPQAGAQDSATPVLARAKGTVPTSEGIDPYRTSVELLTFKITDPEARGRVVPPGELDQPSSMWAGMSGAGVVTDDDLLIGVIRSHTLDEGGRSLTVTPLDAIATLPESVAVRILAALGVADAKVLPRLPLPPETVDTVIVSAAQVVVGTIPQQPLGYVPRDTLGQLARVADAGRVAVVCAVTGQRGVGKTQVAAAYARQRIQDGWGLVGWVNADTPDRLPTDLSAIAEALGVQDSEGDSVRSAARLTRHLTTSRTPGLLVFDNATDPDRLRSYLPAAGAVQVVITSTDQAFTELGAPVPVDTYTRTESVTYLRDRTGLDDDTSADRVAEQLGDHPLALAQAAATIRRRRWPFQVYLDRLAGTPIDQLLTRLPGHDYPLATAPALLLGITGLESDDPSGLTNRVLRLLAVLSSDGVPRNLLQSLTDLDLDIDSDELDEVLEQCAAASAIAWSVTGDAVLMHRLLARVVRERDELNAELDQTLGLAAALVGHQLIPEDLAWQQRDVGAGLIDQIDAVWTALSRGSTAADSGVVTGLLSQRGWAVRHLTAVADLTRAIVLGQAVLADCERVLGPDHQVTLVSRNNLAQAYQAAGQLADAIPLFEQTLTDRERVLGPDHPDILVSRNNLAHGYQAAGRLADAIPLHEQTLTARVRVLGPDHPNTMISRNNLAVAYRSAGRLSDAIPLFEQTLTDCERVLGPDHQVTLASRINLAGAYRSAGRLDDAIPLFEQTLTDCERVLGPDHPNTMISRTDLAGAYRSAGRLDDAIPLFEQTLTDRERVLGPDHQVTLASRINLAGAYRSAGRLDDAIPLFEQTLTDRERVLGPDHPNTMISRNDLAGAYRAAGRLEQAIPLFEQTLADRERVLGPDHHVTLASRFDLAHAYRSAGRLADAVPLYEQTLTDSERVLGPDHPNTMISRTDLAHAYRSAGRLNEAIPPYEQTLADRERVLGPDHPDTMISRINLAYIYQSAGRLTAAIPLYERTLTDRERVLGPDHPDTMISRNNLAVAYQSAGRLTAAIPLLERTLADRERVLGADHPDTLNSRNNLAYTYQSAGRLTAAIPLLERTLADRERVLGADHPDTLNSRNNLGLRADPCAVSRSAQTEDEAP
ncbi:MAG TPA: tetratricopeptide repeat protein [Nakamurella sp.]|nr:tetratricopeptide repeat protein [Nakamurella sp.]